MAIDLLIRRLSTDDWDMKSKLWAFGAWVRRQWHPEDLRTRVITSSVFVTLAWAIQVVDVTLLNRNVVLVTGLAAAYTVIAIAVVGHQWHTERGHGSDFVRPLEV